MATSSSPLIALLCPVTFSGSMPYDSLIITVVVFVAFVLNHVTAVITRIFSDRLSRRVRTAELRASAASVQASQLLSNGMDKISLIGDSLRWDGEKVEAPERQRAIAERLYEAIKTLEQTAGR